MMPKKALLTILVTLITNLTFGQSFMRNFIQNFYTSCKTEKYAAYRQLMFGTELSDWGYSRAIAKCNKAIELDSNYCDAYYMIGYCYQQMGDYKQAITYCDKSLKLNEDNISAWTIKGSTLLIIKDTLNALLSFENAKKYGPTQIDGHYGIALVYYYQHKYKEALSVINEFTGDKKNSATFLDKEKMEELKQKLKTD